MAKKKRGLAARHRRKRSFVSTSRSPSSNPPPMKDMVDFIIPGFVGYAGTRFTGRIAHGMIINRFPRLAKHASVLSAFAAAGLSWLVVHRIDKVKKYHTPVVVGAGIAALQSAVQAYLPKYGWLVSDHQPSQKALPASTGQIAGALTSPTPAAAPILAAAQAVEDLEDLDLGALESDFGIDDDELEGLLN